MTMPSDSGRLPTLELLERELVRRADAKPRPLPRRRLALIVALVLLGALLAATPIGRALAERVADLVGIGDPPSRELIDPVGEPAVVIGVGETPAGERFEIVASTDFQHLLDQATCISLDFPADTGTVRANCLSDEVLAAVRAEGISAIGPALSPPVAPGFTVITGVARPDVDAVVIAAKGPTAPEYHSTLARLGTRLAAQIGADENTGFFVAFVPRGEGTNLVASARGAGGRPIGRQKVRLVDPPPATPRP